ncbi:MAG: hypothetical protein OER04_09675 [Cyclobacteriaceae bacterium]|nr:hypothetical protein [Cyclobacteriaceae bacterium]
MKKFQLLTASWLIALVFCSASIVQAQTQEKRVDKTFNVNSNTRLSIDNRFGKVHINTWDQNKIEVQVVIKAEGSESAAKEILDRITIDIDESPSQISLETEIANSRKNWRNQSFKINYTVKMPKSNPLSVNHRHGDIYLDNFNGPLEMELAHGQIVAEELSGKANITLRHGSGGRISSIGSGSLDIQHYQRLRLGSLGEVNLEIAHANLDIERAGDLDVEIRHSQVEIDEAGAVDVDLQHSQIDGGKFRSLRAEMQHSTVDLEQIQQFVDASSNHGEVKIDRLAKGFSTVEFEGNHSYIGLGLESGATSRLNVNLSYGKLHYSKSEIDMSLINIEDQKAEYKGTIGSNPKGEIRIEGNYTDCAVNMD